MKTNIEERLIEALEHLDGKIPNVNHGGCGFVALALSKAQLLHEDDPYRTNTAEAPEAVTPQPLGIAMNATGTCTATLPAISWISVEFHG